MLFIILYKPFTICYILFILYLKKSKISLSNLEVILIIALIFQLSYIIEIITNNITSYYYNFAPNSSNFLPITNLNFTIPKIISDFFKPVDHSIPLEKLIDIHSIFIICLFVLVICLILLSFYFFINLLILYNKDYFLSKIKNKYALMYIKFVIFKSKIDIIMISVYFIGVLCLMAYSLHYLIIHPIVISS